MNSGSVKVRRTRSALRSCHSRSVTLARSAGGADQADGERLRVADAELEQAVPRYLEDLDLEHDLGLGQVLRGDQPLGEPDRAGVSLITSRLIFS